MPDVHFTHVPRHVRGRPSHVKTLLETPLVDSIDVVDPHRHPRTLVGGVVTIRSERLFQVALASTALAIFAEEDLTFAGTDGPEVGRSTPFPGLLPPKFIEPRKTLLDVSDIQDRRECLRVHAF